jgi:hypothetical protein
MSVLTALDATRICARWSPDDPAAWVSAPRPPERRRAAENRTADYSWWSLVSNPYALLVTGLVGTMATVDAVQRVVAPVMPRS